MTPTLLYQWVLWTSFRGNLAQNYRQTRGDRVSRARVKTPRRTGSRGIVDRGTENSNATKHYSIEFYQ